MLLSNPFPGVAKKDPGKYGENLCFVFEWYRLVEATGGSPLSTKLDNKAPPKFLLRKWSASLRRIASEFQALSSIRHSFLGAGERIAVLAWLDSCSLFGICQSKCKDLRFKVHGRGSQGMIVDRRLQISRNPIRTVY